MHHSRQRHVYTDALSRPLARFVAPALALVSSWGCAAKSLDLGDPELAVDRSALSSYVAVWQGYAEAFRFASGSDRVSVGIREDGTGELVFGEGVPPLPPTDADHPFPDGASVEWTTAMVRPTLIEGFTYGVNGARVEAERVRLQASSLEQYDAACELQTPFKVSEDSADFRCLPGNGASFSRGQGCVLDDQTPVSCGKMELCFGHFCACDASGCKGVREGDIELDAALDEQGTHLVGTLRVPAGSGSATVRLSRVEP